MAAQQQQQPADYKLICTVVGKTPFSVKVSPHDTVDELKKSIKLENPAFKDLAAHDLDLYLIELADDDSLLKKVEELLASQPPPQPLKRPTQKLSAVFLKPPEDGIVHILVQPPPSPSEFLRADPRRVARLTKPSHVVGLGDKRPEAGPVQRKLRLFGESSPSRCGSF
jgi:hypothetical protein